MWWCLAYLAFTSGGEWHGLIWQSLVSLLGLHASFALDTRLERPNPHWDEHSAHGVTNASQFGGLSTKKKKKKHIFLLLFHVFHVIQHWKNVMMPF